MALTFPIAPAGLLVDVLVNKEASVLFQLRQQGIKLSPIQGLAIIDTGSDISAVSQLILQQLGVSSILQTTTQGIGGSHSVRLYQVSLTVFNSHNMNQSWLPNPTLLVMDLPPGVPFDVLIGMDVIQTCKMMVDGPGGVFTLE